MTRKETADVPRYPREELPAIGKALGISPEVLAGALSGVSGEEFTIDQVKGLVDKFLRRKVV